MGRDKVSNHTFLTAVAANGVGTSMPVTDFQNIVFWIATASSGNLTVKCQASIAETEPTWGSAQSTTNKWNYVALSDMEDGTLDTSFVVTGTDDYKLYQLYATGVRWVNFEVSGYAAGSVSAEAWAISNT